MKGYVLDRVCYRALFRDELKVLGYFVDELMAARDDRDFFQAVAKNIVPFVRVSPALLTFYDRCIKESNAHVKLRAELTMKAASEVQQAFTAIKTDLANKGVLSNVAIGQQVAGIEQIFAHRGRYAIPPYFVAAYDEMYSLLQLLLTLGMVDLVKPYAVIAVGNGASYISSVSFMPSLLELRDLDYQWRFDKVRHAWIAWEYVSLAAWCWDTSASFFVSQSAVNESALVDIDLLSLHSHWLQMDDIRESRTSLLTDPFRRELFIGYVKLILHDLMLEQTSNPSLLVEADVDLIVARPHTIELRLFGTIFVLDVLWDLLGAHSMYVLYDFHEKSGPYNLIKTLMDEPVGQSVDIRKVSRCSGGSVAKYLGKMHIKKDSVLRRLFIAKQKTHVVSLKAQSIPGSTISDDDAKELMYLVKSLQPYAPLIG